MSKSSKSNDIFTTRNEGGIQRFGGPELWGGIMALASLRRYIQHTLSTQTPSRRALPRSRDILRQKHPESRHTLGARGPRADLRGLRHSADP